MLLALCLFFTTLPATVYAAEGDAATGVSGKKATGLSAGPLEDALVGAIEEADGNTSVSDVGENSTEDTPPENDGPSQEEDSGTGQDETPGGYRQPSGQRRFRSRTGQHPRPDNRRGRNASVRRGIRHLLGRQQKVAEITTASNGTATYVLLPAGSYYLRELKAPTGYTLETAKIPFAVRASSTIKAEVTNMLESGKVSSTGTTTGTDVSVSAGVIAIPKTGEAFPVMNYVLSALCLGAAALCGAVLRRNRRQKALKG